MISLEEYRARVGGFHPRALSILNERGAKWKKRRKKREKHQKNEDDKEENITETCPEENKPLFTVRRVLLFALLVMFGIVASGGMDGRMNHQTIEILLLRGGVERNPGPVMKSVSENEQDKVIAKLISATDSENIRRMLAPIKNLGNPNHIMTELKKHTVIPLGQLAAHIYNWDENTSKAMRDVLNKQGLIETLQRRLQALNPNNCPNCDQITEPDPINHDSNGIPKCIKCETQMCGKCYALESNLWENSSC